MLRRPTLFGGISRVLLLEITVRGPLSPCVTPTCTPCPSGCAPHQAPPDCPLCLADCLLREENFSVRCPKHKVSQPAELVLPAGLGGRGLLLTDLETWSLRPGLGGQGGQTRGSPVMWSQHRVVGELGRRYFYLLREMHETLS